MAHWLIKSDPETYGWPEMVKDGRTSWNGVRNAQAANNMKAMKKGDRALFYHSGSESAVVGIVEVVKEYYPDPTDQTGRFGMVDVKTVAPVAKPVSLAAIKADKRLSHLALVRQGRLSVSPVDDQAWTLITRLASK